MALGLLKLTVPSYGIPATGFLVETLLKRGTHGDVAEAEAAIDRLAAAPVDDGLLIRDVWLLRPRAQLARAIGDDPTYREWRDRYRAMATELEFDEHIAWAEAMTWTVVSTKTCPVCLETDEL